LAIRHVGVILAIPAVVMLLAPACSPTTKYRVLSFFFDGVPTPGEEEARAAAEKEERSGTAAEGEPGRGRPAAPQYYAHAPYRENRCGACHDQQTGEVFRSDREGLCSACHAELTAQARYVHGPAAVGECLFCHHYHTSPIEKLLLHREPDLCHRCHDPADLTQGPHHAAIEAGKCTECHDPHGGADPMFLRRAER